MLRTTPVFGDPKTDFVFQRIFGSEDHKTALIGFLNDILGLDDAHRIIQVMLLPPEQRPKARRETLLRLLVRAGIALTGEERARIQVCVDAVTLDRWVDNGIGAKAITDVLP